jgi:hypothetical protein
MSTITSTTPAVLVGDERTIYVMAADRSRAAYRRKHGATTLQTIAERRAWTLAHGVPMAAAAERGGMNAVRKMHRARVETLATMTRPDRVGGPVTGVYLDVITREAEQSAARLDALAAPRKTTARKPAQAKNSRVAAKKLGVAPVEISPVAVDNTPEAVEARRAMFAGLGWSTTPAAAPVASVDVAETAPATVPAPMPKMTRAAAKQTRREIAAAMRAEGLRPEGEEWRARCAAAGLVVRDGVSA